MNKHYVTWQIPRTIITVVYVFYSPKTVWGLCDPHETLSCEIHEHVISMFQVLDVFFLIFSCTCLICIIYMCVFNFKYSVRFSHLSFNSLSIPWNIFCYISVHFSHQLMGSYCFIFISIFTSYHFTLVVHYEWTQSEFASFALQVNVPLLPFLLAISFPLYRSALSRNANMCAPYLSIFGFHFLFGFLEAMLSGYIRPFRMYALLYSETYEYRIIFSYRFFF